MVACSLHIKYLAALVKRLPTEVADDSAVNTVHSYDMYIAPLATDSTLDLKDASTVSVSCNPYSAWIPWISEVVLSSNSRVYECIQKQLIPSKEFGNTFFSCLTSEAGRPSILHLFQNSTTTVILSSLPVFQTHK